MTLGKMGQAIVSFVVIAISGITSFGFTAGEQELSSVLDQCESTRSLLRRVSLTSHTYTSKSPSVCIRKTFWACDFVGHRERQTNWLPSRLKGKGNNFDVFHIAVSPEESRSLTHWDFDSGKSIDPANQGVIRAAIGKPEQLLWGVAMRPRADFLFSHFRVDGADEPWELSVNGDWKLLDAKDRNGSSLIVIEGPHPSAKNPGRYFGSTVEITFDQASGMMVKKLLCTMQIDGKQARSEREVVRFSPFGGGVFVPSRIENSWNGVVTTRTEISDIAVNDQFNDSDLSFAFPENVLVPDQDLSHSKVSDRFALFISGRNGELIPIATIDELGTWRPADAKRKTGAVRWLGLSFGCLFGLILFVWMIRNRKNRA